LNIWVDADACPVVIKEILFRAAERLQIPTTLIANKLLNIPRSPWIHALQVPQGFDVADRRIAELTRPGDLVITADIPLAADVIAIRGIALDPRGEFYTTDNIRDRLALRSFMEDLRASGVNTSGPKPFGAADAKAFANQLDRFLAHAVKVP
jgi:hypothetical protein